MRREGTSSPRRSLWNPMNKTRHAYVYARGCQSKFQFNSTPFLLMTLRFVRETWPLLSVYLRGPDHRNVGASTSGSLTHQQKELYPAWPSTGGPDPFPKAGPRRPAADEWALDWLAISAQGRCFLCEPQLDFTSRGPTSGGSTLRVGAMRDSCGWKRGWVVVRRVPNPEGNRKGSSNRCPRETSLERSPSESSPFGRGSDRKPRSWVLLPPFRPRSGKNVCGGGGLRLCLGMAGGGGGGDSRELDQTPTWAVAAVCAVIVLISILLEKGLHHFGEVNGKEILLLFFYSFFLFLSFELFWVWDMISCARNELGCSFGLFWGVGVDYGSKGGILKQ